MGSWLSSLTRSQDVHEAAELADRSVEYGAVPIAQCRRGEVVRVCGTIRTVAQRPRAKAPALEIEVYDGSGHVGVVWLGRRRIPGIDVGRMLVIRGRVTCPMGDPVIFNPEYELRPGPAE